MRTIGVDLGGTNVRAGLVEDDRIIKMISKQINSKGSIAEVLEDIYSLLDILVNDNITGIGIGVPSVVNIDEGIVYDVYNIPSWKQVHLKSILENRYHKSVKVNNDANCFVLGEKHFGVHKSFQNIVGLIIGTGLGAGIIIDGKLYTGTNCGAGEFGLIPFRESILEHYCSGYFFKKYYNISGEELFLKATEGDKKSHEIFNEYGKNLAEAIKIILYTLDPEIIILGGSVSKSFNFFYQALNKNIFSFEYPRSLDKLIIDVSKNENIAILGASALFLDK